MAEDFTEDQPKDGETVFLCAHVRKMETDWHWFHLPEPIRARPPGTQELVEGSWVALCDRCYAVTPNDKVLGRIEDHAQWTGDAPVIKKRNPEDAN